MVMMLLSDQELMDIDAGGWEWITELMWDENNGWIFKTKLVYRQDPPAGGSGSSGSSGGSGRVPGRC